MKFYISSAFLNTREIIEIAKAADELGYDGIGIPDHVVNLETLDTPYPYTKDGQRRWQPFTDWPDPWVLVGALAQVTTRVRFVNTVYIPAMRNPYSAAKAIGTAAVLASGRVELGVGVGWCKEEFALMGEQFAARGKRTDEMLDLMRALWEPGWTEFDGQFYTAPRLEMQPTPPHIPIYVGGLSDFALQRAARHDGWIGDLIKTDRAIEAVGRLREMRAENGFVYAGFHDPDATDRRLHHRRLSARRGCRYHRHHHHAVDVLRRARGVPGRQDRRHAALPQGPRARRLDAVTRTASRRESPRFPDQVGPFADLLDAVIRRSTARTRRDAAGC